MSHRATIPATTRKQNFSRIHARVRARRSADSKSTMNPAFSRVIILCVAAEKTSRDFICESGAWIERGR